jgi:hypothetical protein
MGDGWGMPVRTGRHIRDDDFPENFQYITVWHSCQFLKFEHFDPALKAAKKKAGI